MPLCVPSSGCACREEFIVATKVTGPSGQMPWIRGGPPALDAAAIRAGITGSLQRLGTDYIDLYQLHWPDRCTFPSLSLSWDSPRPATLLPFRLSCSTPAACSASLRQSLLIEQRARPWGTFVECC